MSVELTVREQNLCAEAASHLRSLIYAYQAPLPETQKQHILNRLLASWIMESRPQEWDQIYDKMHRSGHNG